MYGKKVHIHFVGIGGIGMSGIAKILKYQGYHVSGCDLDLEQPSVQELINIGCSIAYGHNTPLCQDPSINIVVYSSAVKSNNPEIIAAQQRSIPTIPRALMLAELMRTKHGIAIAGAHGKTTTTSMISQILIEAGLNPTVIVGGILKSISTNAQLGGGEFLVAEADESDRSLLHLHATLAVITNIDLEHLETYKDFDDIKDTFKQFLNNLPFYGKAIICVDDPGIQSILPIPHVKMIKYGLSSEADVTAKDIVLHPSYSTFIAVHKDIVLGTVQINMPGQHNVLNSLAAIALAMDLEIPFTTIANTLKNFKGIARRFSYHGKFKGAEVFDDYGHHPREIENTLLVAKKRTKNKLHVVFQPHRFSRTQKLWDNFINTFVNSDIDKLIITDIYPASEQPIDGIDSKKLVKAIKEKNNKIDITYLPIDENFNSIINDLESNLSNDDLILLLGAGKVNKIADYIT